ncbi:MAG TPA: DNA internalization-related competence protein ComEC/Rec2 [Burkholderiales bacterium]|nr:DNA internalization-related competence protein ComEC/Rec2 [Burkholderiales bacterium]
MRLNILLFICGVWLLQNQAQLPDWSWACGLPVLLVTAVFFYFRQGNGPRYARAVLLNLFFLGAGFFWAAWLAQARLADALPAEWEGKDIRLSGVVASLPQENERGMRFELDVEEIQTQQAKVPAHISLTWYQDRRQPGKPLPQLHPGERWQLTVRLKRPHGNANPHGFDYEAWLLERNIRATGYVREFAGNALIAESVARPSYLVERMREAVREHLRQELPQEPYAGVLTALAIGDQQAIPQSQWKIFTRTGVNHLMSISGLHVTMVASLVLGLAYLLWTLVPRLSLWLPARKAAVVAGALAALAYALLAGFAVPAQRTVYMLSVVAVALWFGRQSSASLALCIALFVVTLFDPWAVLAPGFWLSFGAVAAIFFVTTGRVGQSHWLATWGRVQWAVTLGLTPLLLILFQQVSLISPLANAVAIPVVSFIVVPLTLLGSLPLLDFLLPAAHLIMQWLMVGLTWMSALPDAVWQQHAPPAWAAVAGVAGVVWLLMPRGFPARWLGCAGLLPLFLLAPVAPEPDELQLTVLDVGQGLAVVARTRNHALLYDTGPAFSSETDSGNRIIVPYLRAAGIKSLDGVIVTHADSDHSGGAISVLDSLPVDWFASSLSAEHPIQTHARRSLTCYAGQAWEWDGVRFDMLHPELSSYQNAKLKTNARGCVLKITSRYGAVLLPADIEKRSEEELLKRAPEQLQADVLVAPHHGSKTSSSEIFIEKVRPKNVIFTVGYRNSFGHPKPEVVERYKTLGGKIYRSDLDGALTLDFDSRGVTVRPYRAERRRYWQSWPSAEAGGAGDALS